MKQVDWVGLWYTVAKERGVNDVVDFGRVNTASGAVEWFDFSHQQCDGAGGMAYALKKLGRAVPPMPRSREDAPPRGLRKARILVRAARGPKPPVMRWKHPAPGARAMPRDFSWHVFSAEETNSILARAAAQKVSVNAWMMAHLTDVLLPELLEGAGPARWLFPVNMRGPVWTGDGLGNHSSAIPIFVRAGTKPAEIHAQIREGLVNGAHWATWWMLHVGKLVGLRGMRYLSRQSAKKSFWLGTFSNMGAWDDEHASPDEAWIVAPPGSENYPIGVGIVTWRGRMAISLKIHPAVCANRALPPRLFTEFVKRLLT